LLLIVIIFCIRYPYFFDWMEGGLVDQVGWVLSGKPLYVRPSLEFTPFIYQPLYTYVSALAARVLGLGFFPLRLVSLLASTGTFYIVYLFVKRESGETYYRLIACGLFSGCYVMADSTINLARVDQLFLFLFMAGAYLVRFRPSRAGYLIAGAILSLSFLTKQTALVAVLPLLVYALVMERNKSLYLIASFAAISGGSVLLLDRIFHGWYSYYVFKMPGRIPFEPALYTGFFKDDMMAPLAIASVVSLFFIVSRLSSDRKAGLYYLMLATGTFAGSWLSRLHSEGFQNVVLPAYCATSIMFALGVREAVSAVRSSERTKGMLAENFILSVCVLQFVLLLYNPVPLIPTEKDLQAGADMVKTMSQFKGDIFAPNDGFIPVLAGKRPHAHYMALYDVLRVGDEADKARLIDDMKRAVQERKFDAIILYPDVLGAGLLTKEELTRNYDVTRVLDYEGTMFWPSKQRGLQFLCVRKQG
jgi:Dolichyl-phosphate-mannose-protein mannosyltransferase